MQSAPGVQAWLELYHDVDPQPWPRIGLLRQALALDVRHLPANTANIGIVGVDGAVPPLDLPGLAATALREQSLLRVASEVRCRHRPLSMGTNSTPER